MLDELIQSARVDIAKGDMVSAAKTYDVLKTTITDTQNLIKEKTNQKLVDRAKSFANEYIIKIDALINNAKELGISDDDVAKLRQVKESLSTTNDPSQIIVKVQRIITINVDIKDSKNQRAAAQNESVESENTTEQVMVEDQSVKQEQKQGETTAQIDKLEARLASLESSIDDTIQPKFDSAKSMLIKLKNQASGDIDQRTLRSLDALIGEIEVYVSSQAESARTDQSADSAKTDNTQAESARTDQSASDSDKKDTKNSSDSGKQKQKRPHKKDN
jgi:hypothetical protein